MLQRALILDVDKSQNTFQHLKWSSLKQQPTAHSLMTPVNIWIIQSGNLNLWQWITTPSLSGNIWDVTSLSTSEKEPFMITNNEFQPLTIVKKDLHLRSWKVLRSLPTYKSELFLTCVTGFKSLRDLLKSKIQHLMKIDKYFLSLGLLPTSKIIFLWPRTFNLATHDIFTQKSVACFALQVNSLVFMLLLVFL